MIFATRLLPLVISGTKTVTRRLKPTPVGKYPLRESVRVVARDDRTAIVRYFDGKERAVPARAVKGARGGTVPSMTAPPILSRYTIEIVSVREERLQDITLADIVREGGPRKGGRAWWIALWDSLSPAGARWCDNPIVFRHEVRVYADSRSHHPHRSQTRSVSALRKVDGTAVTPARPVDRRGRRADNNAAHPPANPHPAAAPVVRRKHPAKKPARRPQRT